LTVSAPPLKQSELTSSEQTVPPRQARAEATRLRLLDATVASLAERGYAGTSTQAVCRQAGVSRGTLLHHFATRDALLLAALRHVLHAVVADFVAARLAEEPVGVEDLLSLMWAQWQGPALTAWLELAVAARTKPELQAPMRTVMRDFDALIIAAFEQLLPEGALPPDMREGAPFFVFAVLNGLAVGRSYEEPGHAQPVLDLLSRLATIIVPSPGDTP